MDERLSADMMRRVTTGSSRCTVETNIGYGHEETTLRASVAPGIGELANNHLLECNTNIHPRN
eukprot:3561628-Amphidinium_carterae.1